MPSEGHRITAPPERFALVSVHRDSVETIQRYLPHNYVVNTAIRTPITDPVTGLPCVLVEGRDDAGWTMDGYVIPRLGSGLIGAREVSADEAVQAVQHG
jgi:hypothetical protein